MMYRGSMFIERIGFCPDGNPKNTHFIEMCKGDGIFTVAFCCNLDWHYEFAFDNVSDYERVKYNVMEQIFECDSIEELLDQLSEIFEDGFDIITEDENDVECANCECHETNCYLN